MNIEIHSNGQTYTQRLASPINSIELLNRLELVTGIPAQEMKASIFNGTTLLRYVQYTQDEIQLASNNLIKVQGTGIVGDVPKYEIEEDAYNQREDTFRKWKQQNKLNEEHSEGSVLECQWKVGDKVQVRTPHMVKKGVVRYIGQVDFTSGLMIGVEYAEPLGKHDGTIADKTYFKCRNKHGAFVKSSIVEEQDEFDEFDDLEEL